MAPEHGRRLRALAVAGGPAILVLVLLALAGGVTPWTAMILAVLAAGAALLTGPRAVRWAAAEAAADDGTAAVGEGDAARAEALTVLDRVPEPILLLGLDMAVLHLNLAAIDLFGVEVRGRELPTLLRQPELLQAVERVLEGGSSLVVELTLAGPVPRDLSCRVASLEPAGPLGARAILLFTDLSAPKRIEQMRADFVANASHEIRTPLAAVAATIETLQGPARDDPAARDRFLASMAHQVDRMTRLVGDLLSLSRVELNELSPPKGFVDLGAVLRRAVESLEWRAQAGQGQLVLDVAPDLPPAVGDAHELDQVFHNLIDNAILHGGPGKTVTISASLLQQAPVGLAWRHRGAAFAIAVRDEGPGIAREHLPRLTERFYRVDAARSRALGTTGLGLAIVKHIVNRHQGVLGVESTSGKGSVFTVYLPAGR
ncbi:ATP-binding protein [Zavarzinia sp. CC-PAN008]|uniref:ATP-binding protein n=1 Tax=Zavarzinia sp. CC-PAN008 TaxID=3243332 RepID=UPI003F7478A7